MDESELKSIKRIVTDYFTHHPPSNELIHEYHKSTGIIYTFMQEYISILYILRTIDVFNSLTFEKQVAICINVYYESCDDSPQYLDNKYAKFYDIMNHINYWISTRVAFTIITRDTSNFGPMLHMMAKDGMEMHQNLAKSYLNMIISYGRI